jgi:hypothetical protein
MTYGFATIFVCFYQLSSYRRQGTLDMLRIAQLTPWEVLRDVFIQLQRVLLPPIAGFIVIFLAYSQWAPEQLSGFGRATVAGGLLGVILTEMLLCAIVCLGLLRTEAALSALAALLVLPLNVAPIGLMYFARNLRERWELQQHHAELYDGQGKAGYVLNTDLQLPWLLELLTASPWIVYVLGMVLVLSFLLWLAKLRLAQLWPAQVRPGKN